MRRRVRDSRGAAQRCGPYFSYLSKAKVKRRWWSNSTYRLRYWNTLIKYDHSWWYFRLQQHLPFTVCVEGCETAEEQSDGEVRTSQVPERSEGKTKMMKQQHLPFTVLKHRTNFIALSQLRPVATAPTVHGIETRLLSLRYYNLR